MEPNLFYDRMFAIFDKDRTGFIDFREFVMGMAIFAASTPIEEKLKCLQRYSPSLVTYPFHNPHTHGMHLEGGGFSLIFWPRSQSASRCMIRMETALSKRRNLFPFWRLSFRRTDLP